MSMLTATISQFCESGQVHDYYPTHMDELSELRGRLRSARIAAGVSQSELARRCGVDPSAINHLESGRSRSLSSDLLLKLARVLSVMPDWLADGKLPRAPRGLIDAAALADAPDHEYRLGLIGTNIDHGPELRGSVPLISWVQAGTWHEADDTFQPGDADEWIPCPTRNGHERIYALRVSGDSMTAGHGKSYPHGCIIFVDPEKRSPTNGDRIIAKLSGIAEVTFKCFIADAGRVWLKPLNPQYPIITDEFRVIGTVVGKYEPE